MATPKVLVLTTVHRADDTRIREKLIPVLARLGEVTHATRAPAPSDPEGLVWRELRGNRISRNLAAAITALRNFDIIVFHDPELLPLALLTSLRRGTHVVFDVHEDIPNQLRSKEWLPRPLRRPAAWLAARLLRIAERCCHITLAEDNYGYLFRKSHPTFPNYPASLPPLASSNGSVIYVGDVTIERGVVDASLALSGVDSERCFSVIGPYHETVGAELVASGGFVTLHGPLPHSEAMKRLATAELAVSPLRDLPNYRHSLPTKVIEYLGLGIPVIASDLPGTRSALAGLPGVRLVRPGDIVAWSEAFRESLSGELRSEAQANAMRVRERFRWPDEKVFTFYEKLLPTAESTPKETTS